MVLVSYGRGGRACLALAAVLTVGNVAEARVRVVQHRRLARLDLVRRLLVAVEAVGAVRPQARANPRRRLRQRDESKPVTKWVSTITSFYGSSCANNGEGANTPQHPLSGLVTRHIARIRKPVETVLSNRHLRKH
eukprot:1196382-Prorocentrum_minimum.AAC.1